MYVQVVTKRIGAVIADISGELCHAKNCPPCFDDFIGMLDNPPSQRATFVLTTLMVARPATRFFSSIRIFAFALCHRATLSHRNSGIFNSAVYYFFPQAGPEIV